MMAKYKKLIFVLRSPYKLGYENSEGKKKENSEGNASPILLSGSILVCQNYL